MSLAVSLAAQIGDVLLRGRDLDGHPLNDGEAEAFDADDLLRVVGHEANAPEAELVEHLRAETEIAQRHVSIGRRRPGGLLMQHMLAQVAQHRMPAGWIDVEQHTAALAS